MACLEWIAQEHAMRFAFRLLAVFLMSFPWARAEGEADLFALSLEELVRLEVTIATGTPKPLAAAPAVTSVITAAELEAMGAQDIDDALEAIPGLHVSHGSFIYASRYFIRGITSTYNPHTLLLVNGVAIPSLSLGDRGEHLPARTGLPVHMIERIEIIRGPGSAVYGADAFAGVINVITKGPLENDGGEIGVARGSFDSTRAFLRQSKTLGPARGILALTYDESDGDDPIITADAQSLLDAQLGTSASLAPGPVNLGYRLFDARGDLVWDDVRLRMSYRRSRIETAQGLNDALDPGSHFNAQLGTMDLTWQAPLRSPSWDLETQLSYFYNDFETPPHLRQLPPGTCLPQCFPEGLISDPLLKEESARAGVTALYTGRENHRLRLGTGFYWGDIFETGVITNFRFQQGAPTLLPQLEEFADTPDIFLPENQRTSAYGFIQDEWAFAPQWELTAGLRYDHYSDFGDTANPRLALVWQTSPTLTSKLLYGEAFRAPSFAELYTRQNPVALGNPHLEPEKLKSLELALNWQPTQSLHWDLNLYEFRIKDFIDFVQDAGGTFTARNTGRLEGRGVETEVRYQPSDTLHLLANYSHQQTRDRNTGQPLGLAPSEEASLRANWGFAPNWRLSPQVTWIGERKRAAGDARPSLDGYMTFDFSLRRHWRQDLDLALTVHNLFDADVREPSRGPEAGQTQANIPDDLPQPGRSVVVEASARW
jgi:iron complex outermembrane receptor protein